jgi:hypothetical protein
MRPDSTIVAEPIRKTLASRSDLQAAEISGYSALVAHGTEFHDNGETLCSTPSSMPGQVTSVAFVRSSTPRGTTARMIATPRRPDAHGAFGYATACGEPQFEVCQRHRLCSQRTTYWHSYGVMRVKSGAT